MCRQSSSVFLLLALFAVVCGLQHVAYAAPNVLIVHGYKGNSNSAWIPSVAARLRLRGHEVCTPNMPDPTHPKLREWVDALLPCGSTLGEDGIVVAHSLGTGAALELVSELHRQGLAVPRALILVGSPIGEVRNRVYEPREWGDDDWEAVRDFWAAVDPVRASHVTSVTLILSLDDPVVKPRDYEFPASWRLVLTDGRGHFMHRQVPPLLWEEVLGSVQ